MNAVIEASCVGLCLVLFLAYVIELRRDARSEQPRSAAGIMAPLRCEWLSTLLREGEDILVVQTLRNWTMFASLMASTSILGGVGAVGFALSHEQAPAVLGPIGAPFGYAGLQGTSYFSFKVLVLAMALFATFLNFSSAIRYYNHVLMCVAGTNNLEQRERVAHALMRRGALHQVTGMRLMYACGALALWVVGAVWLALGSIVVVLTMRRLDRLQP